MHKRMDSQKQGLPVEAGDKKVLLVDEFSTPSPVVVQWNTGVDEAMELMTENGFRHLPVIDESEKPIGVISDRDLKVVSNFEHFETLRVKDLMSPEPYIVDADTPLEVVVMQMSQKKFGSALVIYPEDQSLGIFTSTDALNALIELIRGDSDWCFSSDRPDESTLLV